MADPKLGRYSVIILDEARQLIHSFWDHFSLTSQPCTTPHTPSDSKLDSTLPIVPAVCRWMRANPVVSPMHGVQAHERTLHTDVLFAVIKGIQKVRPRLKIIIM